MARTNNRTQMIVGLILDRLSYYAENLDEIEPSVVDNRGWTDLQRHADYTKAVELVGKLLARETEKNHYRDAGSYCVSIDDIDDELIGMKEIGL